MKNVLKALSFVGLFALFAFVLVGCKGGPTGNSDAPDTPDEELNQLMDEMDGLVDEMGGLEDLDTDL